MQSGKNLGFWIWILRSARGWGQINYRDGAFVGDVAHWVHANASPVTHRAGYAIFVRPSSAPIADVGFVPSENNVERRDTDIPKPQNSAAFRVQFDQSV